jgi:hypothetical protein
LAHARAYQHVSVEGALWSLQRAVDDWKRRLRLPSRRVLSSFTQSGASKRCSMWCAPTLTTPITMSGTSSARSSKSFTTERRPGPFLCAYAPNSHELHNGNAYVSAIRIGARVRRPFRSVPAGGTNQKGERGPHQGESAREPTSR